MFCFYEFHYFFYDKEPEEKEVKRVEEKDEAEQHKIEEVEQEEQKEEAGKKEEADEEILSFSTEIIEKLLKGVMKINIPSQAHIVRIFTSSTFTGKLDHVINNPCSVYCLLNIRKQLHDKFSLG